jgi:hypothetical protein
MLRVEPCHLVRLKFWILLLIIVRLHCKEEYAMYGRLLKVVKRGVYYMAVKWLYEHLFCICGKKDSVYMYYV